MKLLAYTYNLYDEKYIFFEEYTVSIYPIDANWKNWSIISKDESIQLFCAKKNDPFTLYQFDFNSANNEFGTNGFSEIKLDTIPLTAKTEQMAVIFDSKNVHLFIPDQNDYRLLYSFQLEKDRFKYSNSTIQIDSCHQEIEHFPIAMLHRSQTSHYHALNFKTKYLYQAVSSKHDKYYTKVRDVEIEHIPNNVDKSSFSMTNHANTYWLYFLCSSTS